MLCRTAPDAWGCPLAPAHLHLRTCGSQLETSAACSERGRVLGVTLNGRVHESWNPYVHGTGGLWGHGAGRVGVAAHTLMMRTQLTRGRLMTPIETACCITLSNCKTTSQLLGGTARLQPGSTVYRITTAQPTIPARCTIPELRMQALS